MKRFVQIRRRTARANSAIRFLHGNEGAALVEFAIVLPLLVVFITGIYDFGGAFNQRQKIEQAAQEGAIVAGAQPTSDFSPVAGQISNPDSLLPVATAVINSLAGSGVLTASCSASNKGHGPSPALTWTYKITGCSSAYPNDALVITINRGWVAATSTAELDVVGTMVTVTFPYHWRFNSVIQLLIPGNSTFQAVTSVTEIATVHNQM